MTERDALADLPCSCRFHGDAGSHWDCSRSCGCDGPVDGWQWRERLSSSWLAEHDRQRDAVLTVGHCVTHGGALWSGHCDQAPASMSGERSCVAAVAPVALGAVVRAVQGGEGE